MIVFSVIAVVGLIGAGVVHLYWAFGGTWPGSDRSDLARKVVGSTDEFPSTVMTLGVATLLLLASLVVGAATDLWAPPVAKRLVTGAAWIVAAVLVLRGLVGLVVSGTRQVRGRGTAFAIRDVLIYSPLTLLLGGLTAVALLPTP